MQHRIERIRYVRLDASHAFPRAAPVGQIPRRLPSPLRSSASAPLRVTIQTRRAIHLVLMHLAWVTDSPVNHSMRELTTVVVATAHSFFRKSADRPYNGGKGGGHPLMRLEVGESAADFSTCHFAAPVWVIRPFQTPFFVPARKRACQALCVPRHENRLEQVPPHAASLAEGRVVQF